MATPTYDPIASTTLTSSASSVTFSSLDTIAAGYRDLVLVANLAASTSATLLMSFNSDTNNANYSFVSMYGTGSAAASTNSGSSREIARVYNTFGMLQMSVFDQAESKHKSSIIRYDDASVRTQAYASSWKSTAAITSLQLEPLGQTFAAGSTFSLYGIAA